ncbi:MAG: DNRLRE domain-containing protein, partial [Spirochaetaceae bacterium]|nr:DNRLRE domain-containing protein [Spirochaetaceae bacterium]
MKKVYPLVFLFIFVLAGCSETIPDEGLDTLTAETDSKTLFVERFQSGSFPVSTFDGISDTYIHEGNSSTNYNASDFLALNEASGNNQRILMEFDLRGYLPETITIEKASLTFTRASSLGVPTIEIYELSDPWSQTSVTWDNYGNGGAYNSTLLGSLVTNND